MNTPVTRFAEGFGDLPSSTRDLLLEGRLTVHPAVRQVTVHGSRGLKGAYRPDSDLDVSLVVDTRFLPALVEQQDAILQAVVEATLAAWKGSAELDVAAVFDVNGCGLRCFDCTMWCNTACSRPPSLDCFGVFKTQKGFSGRVPRVGIDVRLMYPCCTVWRRGPGTTAP